MSNRLKGTLAGIGASLGGVGLWIILGAIGFIAGIAGGLMGILFIIAYKALNKEDQTKYPYIVACVLVAVEIVLSELLLIAVLAAMNSVPFGDVLADSEVQTGMIIDIVVGFLLGYLVFGSYLYSLKRKSQMQNIRKTGVPPAYQNPGQNPGFDQNGGTVDPNSSFYNPYAQNPGTPAAQPQEPQDIYVPPGNGPEGEDH